MSVLDTPTKAARCGRPKTRGWLDLVRAAREDEAEAKRLRAELSRYLAGADRLSARRAARRAAPPLPPPAPPPGTSASVASAAVAAEPAKAPAAQTRAVPPPRKKKKTPDGAGEPEVAADPEIPDWGGRPADAVAACIATLGTPWTERVAALRAVAARPAELARAGGLVQGLCVQLDDLRSRIVVEGAEAVLALAPHLDDVQSVALFRAALAGIAVKKAVMADARERAAVAALRAAAAHDAAWAAAIHAVEAARHERGRRVGVDVVAVWAAASSLPDNRDAAVAKVLAKAAVDKAPAVREAARNLHKAFADAQGAERAKAMRALLPPDARARLPAQGAPGSAAGKGFRKNLAGRMNMKDLIRQKKLAMMKSEAAKKKAALSGKEQGSVLMEVVNSAKKTDSNVPGLMS